MLQDRRARHYALHHIIVRTIVLFCQGCAGIGAAPIRWHHERFPRPPPELTSTMTRRRTFARLLVPLTAWLVASAASGQAPSSAAVPEPRQRIGLVLSGGGARGGAHIGVLKALQELRVPIDAIAG